MISQEHMLEIMEETGAFDDLDINVKVMQRAYVAGQAALADMVRFARAAAKHATTDSVDSWNGMVDAWDLLPEDVQRELLS